MTGRGEADFSQPNRRSLAERAGFRCSVPYCGLLTIGPGAEKDKSASIGTAAHIHSASLKGPRGRGGLTDADLAEARG